ncbi:MAG: methyltransferase family protein [Anaerolineales bacterium]
MMIALKIHLLIFLLLTLLLLGAAYLVFRVIVRRDYRLRGKLTWMSSTLQLLVFIGLMSYPYLYNPPEWAWSWLLVGPTSLQQQITGLVIILLGFFVAFGTMAWFGLRRAFGLETQEFITTGPYRITRNPQILGGYLLVIGVSVQWPSWYAVAWIVLYGVVGHWMITTEEEHLQEQFGDDFSSYCEQVPRYLLKSRTSR